MRSDDLLAAVFPAQVQCQDNAFTGEIEAPDHPLVFEAIRDCLTEAMDLEGLKGILTGIEKGEIEVYARDTVQPSVFAHQILNAMPYAFLDDAPLEERRARAVSLRRALPEDAQELGALDPKAIDEESQNAWPAIRDRDELHDALLVLGLIPETEAPRPDRRPGPVDLGDWFEELAQAGRAFRLRRENGACVWVATERLPMALAVYPDASLEPEPAEGLANAPDSTREAAIPSLLRGWVECLGPFTPDEMANTLGLDRADVDSALARLEAEGSVLRGRFRPGSADVEFCDRRILARIHRATIAGLRREVEPVPQATFVRYLFQWQHADPGSQLKGEGGLLDVVELLQGFEAATAAWEPALLGCRITDYDPMLLDRLCLGGETVWGRLTRQQENGDAPPGRATMSGVTPITLALREALDWLWDPHVDMGPDLAGAPREVLATLSRRGACFLRDIVSSTRRLPSDVEEALWSLAAVGRVTADGFDAVRKRMNGNRGRGRRTSRLTRTRARQRARSSRWSLLEAVDAKPEPTEARARQLLRRYGVLLPEVLVREPMAPRWRDLAKVLRRLEARGEIRGGRFVAGFVGEQFALPEAADTLRRVKNSEPTGSCVVVSACDPLNVVGILTPGNRVPATPRNRIVFRDGVPVCSLENGFVVVRATVEEACLAQARSLLRL